LSREIVRHGRERRPATVPEGASSPVWSLSFTSHLVERRHHGVEVLERRLEFLDDLSREDVGRRKVGGVLEAVVFEPQQIEVGLGTGEEVLVEEGKRFGPLFITRLRRSLSTLSSSLPSNLHQDSARVETKPSHVFAGLELLRELSRRLAFASGN